MDATLLLWFRASICEFYYVTFVEKFHLETNMDLFKSLKHENIDIIK